MPYVSRNSSTFENSDTGYKARVKNNRRRFAYFQKTLHFSLFTPIFIIMLNQCMLLRQYKNSPPKAQITAFKNSLLKIGGVDARSLVEIKRRRIGYTLSIYFGVATTQIPTYLQKNQSFMSFIMEGKHILLIKL